MSTPYEQFTEGVGIDLVFFGQGVVAITVNYYAEQMIRKTAFSISMRFGREQGELFQQSANAVRVGVLSIGALVYFVTNYKPGQEQSGGGDDDDRIGFFTVFKDAEGKPMTCIIGKTPDKSLFIKGSVIDILEKQPQFTDGEDYKYIEVTSYKDAMENSEYKPDAKAKIEMQQMFPQGNMSREVSQGGRRSKRSDKRKSDKRKSDKRSDRRRSKRRNKQSRKRNSRR